MQILPKVKHVFTLRKEHFPIKSGSAPESGSNRTRVYAQREIEFYLRQKSGFDAPRGGRRREVNFENSFPKIKKKNDDFPGGGGRENPRFFFFFFFFLKKFF